MITEAAVIELMRSTHPRSPLQQNGCWQADCELLRLPGVAKTLAITTDGLSEELETGLYDDPFHIGWMLVTINASDLAAVAATPTGIVCNVTLARDGKCMERAYLEQLNAGLLAACEHYALPLLGGDTNFANYYQLSATALGLCEHPLTRLGAKPGDFVCVSAPVGTGNWFAFNRLFLSKPATFFPKAPLTLMQTLSPLVSSCMDISDGLLEALEMLSMLNNTGVMLYDSATYLAPEVIATASTHGLPKDVFLAGHHGDFETVFTIAPKNLSRYQDVCTAHGHTPLIIGEITDKEGITLPRQHFPLHTFRDAWEESGDNLQGYFERLVGLM